LMIARALRFSGKI